MNKDGRYGFFYDAPNKMPKNKTRALQLSDEEAIEMAIEKLRRDRRLSINTVHSLLFDFAPRDMYRPTRVSKRARLCTTRNVHTWPMY